MTCIFSRLNLLWIIIYASANTLTGQGDNPFLNIPYDSLVLYDFDWQAEGSEFMRILSDKDEIASTVKKSVKLNVEESKELINRMGSKGAYGGTTAFCFEPHLGIVFFKDNEPVISVNICLRCNRLESSIRISAQEQGKQGKGAEIYYTKNGMSKEFRNYVNGLLIKNDFSYQIQEGLIFDK